MSFRIRSLCSDNNIPTPRTQTLGTCDIQRQQAGRTHNQPSTAILEDNLDRTVCLLPVNFYNTFCSSNFIHY